jgi:uncharacterized membrane protein YdbT with pleckstrin-like domain
MDEGAKTEAVDNSNEQIIWSGSSSQLRNLHIYIFCVLFALLIVPIVLGLGDRISAYRNVVVICWVMIPLIYTIIKWIQLRSRYYELTTQRVRLRQGIFSKRTDELELYRVKDSIVFEPFWQRLCGLGNIVITTNDTTNPSLTLEALPTAKETREKLRTAIEDCRDRKRVRIAELE